MARITVEDCLGNVENRFHLALLAAKRARQLMRGSVDPTVPWENDKATVVALREIANGHTDFSDAHEATDNPEPPKAEANNVTAQPNSGTVITPPAEAQAPTEAENIATSNPTSTNIESPNIESPNINNDESASTGIENNQETSIPSETTKIDSNDPTTKE